MRATASGALLLILMASAAMPAHAQGQIDIDWGRVRTCAGLNGFIGTWGTGNRYRNQIAQRRVQLCRPAPRPTPVPPRPPVVTPRPPVIAPRPPRPAPRPPVVTPRPPRPSPRPPVVSPRPPRLTPRPPIASPRPVPRPPAAPQPAVLTGTQVADLYRGYRLCYRYDPRSNSCQTVEIEVERTASTIRIARLTGIRIAPEQREEWGGGASFLPEGAIVAEYQTLTITRTGLCRSRSTTIEDAGQTFVQIVEAVNNPESPILDADDVIQERVRANGVAAAERLEVEEYCARYRTGSERLTLLEEGIADGRPTGAAPTRVTLLPVSSPAPSLQY